MITPLPLAALLATPLAHMGLYASPLPAGAYVATPTPGAAYAVTPLPNAAAITPTPGAYGVPSVPTPTPYSGGFSPTPTTSTPTSTSTPVASPISPSDPTCTGTAYDCCTEDTCPISKSFYGYRPSLGANAAAAALFALSLIAYFVEGLIWRRNTWGFTLVMMLGTFGELIGYLGRIALWHNVFSKKGFEIQIICLTVAPAFLSAGLYLMLKHIVKVFGTKCSRIKPALYTWIFIISDIVSIFLQGVGGGLTATADDSKKLDLGNNLVLAGVVFQVFTLSIFALLALDYMVRTRKYKGPNDAKPAASFLATFPLFKLFVFALATAFTAIMVRCVYRIVNMAAGAHSSITKDQPLFIALDTAMILIAALVLNIFHPGLCFHGPEQKVNRLAEVKSIKSTDEGEDEWSYRPRGPAVYPRPSRPSFQPRQKRSVI